MHSTGTASPPSWAVRRQEGRIHGVEHVTWRILALAKAQLGWCENGHNIGLMGCNIDHMVYPLVN
jgi:hypothetical protein